MRARHPVSRLLLGIILSSPATLVPGADRVHRVPFKLERNHFVVVGGTIKKHPIRIMIDTGTTHTVIDRGTVRRVRVGVLKQHLSVRSFGRLRTLPGAVLTHLEIGTYSIPPVPCIVGDLEYAGVDLILGLDVLRRASLTIDYERQLVEFGSVQRFPDGIPLETGTHLAVVLVEIEGNQVRLAIDSGAARISLYRDRIRAWGSELDVTGHAHITTLAGRSRVRRVALRDVRVGGFSWAEHEGFLLDAPPSNQADGVLGLVQLGLRRIHFDFSTRKVSLQR